MLRGPGARAPRYRWLTWGPIALFLLWLAGTTHWVHVPPMLVLAAFVVLIILNAIVFFPGTDDAHVNAPARHRLPVLAVLALPWIVAILCGPLGFVATSADPARRTWMILLQDGALAGGLLLPLLLLPAMRGGRRFTLAIGMLNLVLTFLVTAASTLIIDPEP